ncbi:hypothetical protein IL306_014080 [Fusarium sp. DS 682]|nr:hypothetical protein IL306_014080 [Fusarium sp. DS 682]
MDQEVLTALAEEGLTFLTAAIAAQANDKTWDGPHWLPDDVRKHIEQATSLWGKEGALRLAATLPGGHMYLTVDAAMRVCNEMRDVLAAVPDDNDKEMLTKSTIVPQSQSQGMDVDPFPPRSDAPPRRIIVGYRDRGNPHIRLSKRKRGGSNNADASPVVPEGDKPVLKVAKRSFRPINHSPTTSKGEAPHPPVAPFEAMLFNISMEFLESKRNSLIGTFNDLQRDTDHVTGNLNKHRVDEEADLQLGNILNDALREIETTLTLGTNGASSEEANHRLEGANLLRDRINTVTYSTSTEQIQQLEGRLQELAKSRDLIKKDLGRIKAIMDAKSWYDGAHKGLVDTLSRIEKVAEDEDWMRLMV